MTDKKEQIARFIQREFPQTRVVVEAVGERSATVWQAVDPAGAPPLRAALRPPGAPRAGALPHRRGA